MINETKKNGKGIKMNNNGGLKTLLTITSIVAIVGGMAAIVRPIQSQLDAYMIDLTKIEAKQLRIQEEISNLGSEIASIKVLFQEVETQFTNIDKRLDREILRATTIDEQRTQDMRELAAIIPRVNRLERDVQQLLKHLVEK